MDKMLFRCFLPKFSGSNLGAKFPFLSNTYRSHNYLFQGQRMQFSPDLGCRILRDVQGPGLYSYLLMPFSSGADRNDQNRLTLVFVVENKCLIFALISLTPWGKTA